MPKAELPLEPPHSSFERRGRAHERLRVAKHLAKLGHLPIRLLQDRRRWMLELLSGRLVFVDLRVREGANKQALVAVTHARLAPHDRRQSSGGREPGGCRGLLGCRRMQAPKRHQLGLENVGDAAFVAPEAAKLRSRSANRVPLPRIAGADLAGSLPISRGGAGALASAARPGEENGRKRDTARNAA
jgi:hypothetical protein